MRLFRPPFVGFKIFIADFIMVHPIRQGKKNIGMAWHIVSMFVYDFAKAREVFTPQRNLCAQQDSVAFALQPLLVCFDRFAFGLSKGCPISLAAPRPPCLVAASSLSFERV